jgi:hypothetical protein
MPRRNPEDLLLYAVPLAILALVLLIGYFTR